MRSREFVIGLMLAALMFCAPGWRVGTSGVVAHGFGGVVGAAASEWDCHTSAAALVRNDDDGAGGAGGETDVDPRALHEAPLREAAEQRCAGDGGAERDGGTRIRAERAVCLEIAEEPSGAARQWSLRACFAGKHAPGMFYERQNSSAEGSQEAEPCDTAANTRHTADEGERVYLGRFYVTGYDICLSCCGKLDGVTASGAAATVGRTCAAAALPFGTRLWIEGIGERVVEDRGGMGAQGLDVLCEDHESCYAVTGWRDVWILEDAA